MKFNKNVFVAYWIKEIIEFCKEQQRVYDREPYNVNYDIYKKFDDMEFCAIRALEQLEYKEEDYELSETVRKSARMLFNSGCHFDCIIKQLDISEDDLFATQW